MPYEYSPVTTLNKGKHNRLKSFTLLIDIEYTLRTIADSSSPLITFNFEGQNETAMVKRETYKRSYVHANANTNTNVLAVLFMVMLPFLLTQQAHAERAFDDDLFYNTFDVTLDERFEIEFDGSISELVSGIDFIVAAQEHSGKIVTSQVRALEEDDEDPDTDNGDVVEDDAVVQILFNENFAKCNNETMQFYRENPHINKAVREFGDSATATWSGPNFLNLNLDFNETMKDRMKDACKNNPDESLNITTSGEQGKYAFAGDLNCTYRIQGGETANTSITNYANCVADTDACNAVDETDFLRIIMHSLGSACSGLEREGTLRCDSMRFIFVLFESSNCDNDWYTPNSLPIDKM